MLELPIKSGAVRPTRPSSPGPSLMPPWMAAAATSTVQSAPAWSYCVCRRRSSSSSKNTPEYIRGDAPEFRILVRRMLLHENGHYLGLDEGEVLCGVSDLTGRNSLPVACPARSGSAFSSRSGAAHSPQSCPLAADPAASLLVSCLMANVCQQKMASKGWMAIALPDSAEALKTTA